MKGGEEKGLKRSLNSEQKQEGKKESSPNPIRFHKNLISRGRGGRNHLEEGGFVAAAAEFTEGERKTKDFPPPFSSKKFPTRYRMCRMEEEI